MNKKWIASLASVCLLASSCFTAAMAEGMKPGTYTEVTRGMYDGLTVDVTVSEDKIEDIKVTAYNETAPGWPALEKMPAAILERSPWRLIRSAARPVLPKASSRPSKRP